MCAARKNEFEVVNHFPEDDQLETRITKYASGLREAYISNHEGLGYLLDDGFNSLPNSGWRFHGALRFLHEILKDALGENILSVLKANPDKRDEFFQRLVGGDLASYNGHRRELLEPSLSEVVIELLSASVQLNPPSDKAPTARTTTNYARSGFTCDSVGNAIRSAAEIIRTFVPHQLKPMYPHAKPRINLALVHTFPNFDFKVSAAATSGPIVR